MSQLVWGNQGYTCFPIITINLLVLNSASSWILNHVTHLHWSLYRVLLSGPAPSLPSLFMVFPPPLPSRILSSLLCFNHDGRPFAITFTLTPLGLYLRYLRVSLTALLSLYLHITLSMNLLLLSYLRCVPSPLQHSQSFLSTISFFFFLVLMDIVLSASIRM